MFTSIQDFIEFKNFKLVNLVNITPYFEYHKTLIINHNKGRIDNEHNNFHAQTMLAMNIMKSKKIDSFIFRCYIKNQIENIEAYFDIEFAISHLFEKAFYDGGKNWLQFKKPNLKDVLISLQVEFNLLHGCNFNFEEFFREYYTYSFEYENARKHFHKIIDDWNKFFKLVSSIHINHFLALEI